MSIRLGINWEITKKCNLRCRYCRVSAGEEKEGELTFQQAKKVVGKLKQAGYSHLKFTGGEPLTKSYFWDLVKYAHGKGMLVSVFTNSVLIHEVLLPLFKKYISLVAISLDTLNDEHNAILRRTKAEFVLQKIQLLKRSGIPVVISTTVTKINVKDLPELIKKAKAIGVQEIKINDFVDNGRASENLSLLKLNKPLRNNISSTIDNIQTIYQETPTQNNAFKCECDDNNLFINYRGDVFPCVELSYLSNEFCLGNIVKDRSINIFKLNKDFYSKIKERDICGYNYISSPHFSACLNRDKCPLSLLSYIREAKVNANG